jgi:hypothetical protein
MSVDAEDYPVLADFMDKCLFQLAAPTFEEAILQWTVCGSAEVRRLLSEINRALAAGHSDVELSVFIAQHSDYSLPHEPAHRTLAYFATVLREWEE